jgi:hypothetical protein
MYVCSLKVESEHLSLNIHLSKTPAFFRKQAFYFLLQHDLMGQLHPLCRFNCRTVVGRRNDVRSVSSNAPELRCHVEFDNAAQGTVMCPSCLTPGVVAG